VIPAPKVNELINELKLLLPERQPSPLALARIRRESQKVLRSHVTPDEAHMILGTVAALEFGVEEFFEHFRIAQQLSSHSNIRRNFAVMAMRCGFVREAYEATISLMRSYPDDLGILRLAREFSVNALQFGSFFEAEERLKRLNDKPESGVIAAARFHELKARADQLDISPEDVLDRLEFAGAIVRNAKEPIFSTLFDIGLEGRFSYSFGVKCDTDTLCDLNFKIAELIVSTFDDTLADLFTIGCLIHRSDMSTGRLSDARPEAQQ